MLPTQGQGASQSIEDAEALGAFFSASETQSSPPSFQAIQNTLRLVFESRHQRATLIQKYSRESAKPATEEGKREVKM
jgi:salicylate hydroxylase